MSSLLLLSPRALVPCFAQLLVVLQSLIVVALPLFLLGEGVLLSFKLTAPLILLTFEVPLLGSHLLGLVFTGLSLAVSLL